MKKIKLKVMGMKCRGCENRIVNVLQNIEGVKKVKANYIKEEVKVILSDEINQEIIEKAINNLDYQVTKEK